MWQSHRDKVEGDLLVNINLDYLKLNHIFSSHPNLIWFIFNSIIMAVE